MAVNRREFLAGVGGAGLAYAFHIGCADDEPVIEVKQRRKPPPVRSPDDPGIDYRHWLVVEVDGSVTAYTCRVEIGQGFKTVLYNVLCQGMELPEEQVKVVLGDTAVCPADGPTTGSAATQFVVWGFWRACSWVRSDLVRRAAERIGMDVGELKYQKGKIVDKNGAVQITIAELADEPLQITTIDPDLRRDPLPPYVDKETLNVNGEAIVTGTQVYAGDLYPEGVLYGGKLRSPFHYKLSRLQEVDTAAAEAVPDVVAVRHVERNLMVFGRTYTAMRKGLAQVRAVWEKPQRPQRLDNEKEIRAGAELVAVLEEKGDVESELSRAERVVAETYLTQYATPTPMETHTAVADVQGDKAVVWTGTQNPLLMRYRIARKWKVPEENIRIIGMPVGGGFGSKAGHWVPSQAANLAREIGTPVKLIYSRNEQFNARASYKESVIIDISSAADAAGRVTARRIDIYRDAGIGTQDVYDVPNVRTRLFKSPMPVRHAVMRGTSYVQICYALESHTDMLAETVGMDPLEFRKLNVALKSFRPLLNLCGEMAGWGVGERRTDHGKGIALCHHGGRQLGVVVAEVDVDRQSGRIKVERLWGTFDIGQIINRNTLSLGVKGAMLWGLGYALTEEVELDGHRSHTASFSDYQIPRFSDTPPIEIEFLDRVAPGVPRGCGELPVIPTVGAICNAVYDAIGVRFHELPLTPERVKRGLAEA